MLKLVLIKRRIFLLITGNITVRMWDNKFSKINIYLAIFLTSFLLYQWAMPSILTGRELTKNTSISFMELDGSKVTLHISYHPKIWVDSLSESKGYISLWIEETFSQEKSPNNYVVFLESVNNNIIFQDSDGQEIISKIAISPISNEKNPVLVYLQPSTFSTTETIKISLSNPSRSTTKIPITIQRVFFAGLNNILTFTFDKVTVITVIIGVFSTRIASFYSKQEEERRKKYNRGEEKLLEFENLLIYRKFSDGTRKYLTLLYDTDIQNFPDHQIQLQSIFKERVTQPEIKLLVKLRNSYENKHGNLKDIFETEETKDIKRALEYGIRQKLDSDWATISRTIASEHKKKLNPTQDSEDMIGLVFKENWHNIIKYSPDLDFWHHIENPITPKIQAGLEFLGLNTNPFGVQKAEHYANIEKEYRPIFPYAKAIQEMNSTLIFGKTGTGKTASSLWLSWVVYNSLNIFPVYIPFTSEISWEHITEFYGKTLIRYFAQNPQAYLKRGRGGKIKYCKIIVIQSQGY